MEISAHGAPRTCRGGPAVRNITISRCIIAECLQKSAHIDEGKTEPGSHSMGLLVGDGSIRVTVFGNLFITNDSRNPVVKQSQQIEVINNFAYNYGGNGLSMTGQNSSVNAINNVYVPGPNSPSPDTRTAIKLDGSPGSHHFLSGNLTWRENHWKTDWYSGSGTPVSKPAFSGSGLEPMPVDQVEAYVLTCSGAHVDSPARLDAIDQYLVDYVIARKGEANPPDNVYESCGYLEEK